MTSNWNIEGSKCGQLKLILWNSQICHLLLHFINEVFMLYFPGFSYFKQVGCLFLSDILLVMCPWRWASIKFSIEHKYW
jgi:hypothetical protein